MTDDRGQPADGGTDSRFKVQGSRLSHSNCRGITWVDTANGELKLEIWNLDEIVKSPRNLRRALFGFYKYLKPLDSRFRGNDGKRNIRPFYEPINLEP